MVQYLQQRKDLLARKPESIEKLFPAKTLDGVDPAEAATLDWESAGCCSTWKNSLREGDHGR